MGAAINSLRTNGPGEHLSLPFDWIEIFTGRLMTLIHQYFDQWRSDFLVYGFVKLKQARNEVSFYCVVISFGFIIYQRIIESALRVVQQRTNYYWVTSKAVMLFFSLSSILPKWIWKKRCLFFLRFFWNQQWLMTHEKEEFL